MKLCPHCGREFGDADSFCAVDGRPLAAGSRATIETTAPAHTPAAPRLGESLNGRFELLESLGQGGMGVVYAAWDNLLKRRVAIKVLLSGAAGEGDALERFVREAQAAARTNHPNIARIYDLGRAPAGFPFLVMELVRGPSLDKLLRGEGRGLECGRAVAVASQVCSAVAAAHEEGVVHRDLKPQNVIVETVDGRETARVLDFGIAKLRDARPLTLDGRILGTPYYMSPEQCRGEAVDHRTDIYSMGVMFYEMLSGAPPFTGESLHALLHKQVNERPRPLAETRPDLPPRVTAAVMRALDKEPAARQQHASELGSELAAALSEPDMRLALTLPTHSAEVFVSCAEEDEERARRLRDWLAEAGVPVYVGPAAADQSAPTFRGLGAAPGGRRPAPEPEVERAVRDSKVLLLVASDAAMRSPRVKRDLQLAWKYERMFIPLMLSPLSFREQVGYLGMNWPWLEMADRPEQVWGPQLLHSLSLAGVRSTRRLGGPPEGGSGPARFTGGLEGLRTVAKFTDLIWPVPAEAVAAAPTRPLLRGLGAPQDRARHSYRLGDRLRLAIESERAGHLLLLDEGPEAITYCLCPSWFAPDTTLPRGRTYLPQPASPYPSFEVSGRAGREHLLALVTDEPLGLPWLPADSSVPARVLDRDDIEEMVARVRGLDAGRWTALATYFDVAG